MTILQELAASNAAPLVELIGDDVATAPAPLMNGFDNQPTWDNVGGGFDNWPTWDNWSNK
jgi:hypothetical protein